VAGLGPSLCSQTGSSRIVTRDERPYDKQSRWFCRRLSRSSEVAQTRLQLLLSFPCGLDTILGRLRMTADLLHVKRRNLGCLIWIICHVIAGLCISTDIALGDTGLWVAEDSFAQVNVFCLRTYRCVTGQDILHSADTVVKTTSPILQKGVCSAAGGPADSCNECLTNPPSEPCTWSVVPK
jgi:hypothetical protein